MIETIIAASIVSLLCGTLMAPMQWVLDAAALLVGGGFAFGVPTGIWYHIALSRALSPRGQLPARWWIRPTAFHPMLTPEERPQVLRWFYAGGIGFLLTALGCITLAGAALRLIIEVPA